MNIYIKLRNYKLWILVLFICNLSLQSQVPVLKVDLNIGTRTEAEVNEPGYIPWPIYENLDSMTLEGVTFAFKNGTVSSDWYKTGVQIPYYARLVNDGLKTSQVELHISGLQNGMHSMVTFHNATSNPDNNTYSPIDISIKREIKADGILESHRVLSNELATTAYFQFEVTNNEPIVIIFRSEMPGVTFMINGFHLNKSDPKKIIKFPYPSDNDEHVDIDNDTLIFRWKSPENTISHNLFFGKDKTSVLLANTDSSEFLGNITDTFFIKSGFYNMDNYYWRVDPIDIDGDTTKGDVLYFKKRIPAFPKADGYGKYAIGGRGGKVVYVTNLKDDGMPGCFRYAVDSIEGPRTILFAVSGLITLNDRLSIKDDYVTVAGQTAPGKGICFRWAPVGVTGDNLIIQNLRVRIGYGVTFDGMGLTGAESSIVDHCSISWTIDEAFSSRGAKNITLQRSLISEALNDADHDKYDSGTQHGYAGSIGGNVGSFHHNLLAHCNGRNWSMAGGLDGDLYYAGRLDIFNMVVYNWGSRATDGGAHEVNFVNNYYKKGAATTQNTILKADLEGTGNGTQSYYSAGNIVENTSGTLACDGTDNTCSRTYTISNGQIVDWDVFVDEPFFSSQATIHSASDAYKIVLSDVGCTQPVFDDHDKRIINETLTSTYSVTGSRTGKPGLPDHEKDAGNWEAYPGFIRPDNWDSDLDGLPNWWEKAKGLDSLSAQGDFNESNADLDKNGYTNLEEFLQWMDKPHYFLINEDSLDIDLSLYTHGFTNSPVFEIKNTVNGTAQLHNNSSIANFKPSSEGLSELEFMVSDDDGTSLTKKIGVYKGYIAGNDSMFTYSYQLERDGNSIVTVDSVNTVYTPVSIKSIVLNLQNLVVYPNPAQQNLYINFKADNKAEVDIEILDIVGVSSYKSKFNVIHGANTINIDLNQYMPGMYFLNIENKEFKKVIRFIKK